MTSNSTTGSRVFRVGLGCVAALAGFYASAEISHQFFESAVDARPTGELLAVVVLLSLAIGLSWMSPLAGASAGVTLIAVMAIGATVWSPQYLDVDPGILLVDPLGSDVEMVLSFGSQQLTSAALLPALLLPALLRWSTMRPRGGLSRAPDHEGAVVDTAPAAQ